MQQNKCSGAQACVQSCKHAGMRSCGKPPHKGQRSREDIDAGADMPSPEGKTQRTKHHIKPCGASCGGLGGGRGERQAGPVLT
eukprot:7421965-Alexandrium_andersonii.AAC.1